MSKQQKIHIFNCDRTYKLDVVKDWLAASESTGSVEEHYFYLPEMTDFIGKTIPKLEMDVAVFVVHAHESRLSINEEKAGIGYATFYRALLQKTGERVLIVIGGDDSYTGEDEKEIEFISRWAKRKISSQFGEEFLDGRKSFIFSWDKQHRNIHEKALTHFFDPAKKGLKFKYQPPAKPPPVLTTGPSALPSSSSERRRTDVGVQSTKPESYYPPKESTEVHTRDLRAKPESRYPLKESREVHTRDLAAKTESRYPPKESREVHSRDHGARSKEKTEERSKEIPITDLAVLGCNVSETSMDAVRHQIETMAPELKLKANPVIRNFFPVDLKQFLETESLRFCVLVVDSKTVKDAYGNLPVGPRNEYHDLLHTAVDTVAEKVIILVCDNLPLPKQDKIYISQAIDSMAKERNKVFTTWLKEGKLEVDPDVFAKILISGSSAHLTKPQINCSESSRGQADASPCASNTVPSQTSQGPSGGYYKSPALWGHEFQQQFQQPHADTATAPKQNTKHSPTCRERLLLKSKLRNGKISYLPNDLEAHCPGFQVPRYIDEILLQKYGKISAGVPVKIVAEPNIGALRWIVTPESTSIAKGMAVNETVVLQTRIRYGAVSMEKGDLEFIYPGWKTPEYLKESLKREYWATPNAKLFVISDEKGELRFLAVVDLTNRAYGGIRRKLKNN